MQRLTIRNIILKVAPILGNADKRFLDFLLAQREILRLPII